MDIYVNGTVFPPSPLLVGLFIRILHIRIDCKRNLLLEKVYSRFFLIIVPLFIATIKVLKQAYLLRCRRGGGAVIIRVEITPGDHRHPSPSFLAGNGKFKTNLII